MMILKKPKNKIILIVAPPAGKLDVLFDYLRGFGYDVLLATDGESAIPMAEYANPHIILLDVVLPGMDGFETCIHLKEKATTQDIPIIFITDTDNLFDRVRGFSLGAVDYITKPIHLEEVLARLKTHLTMRNLRHSLEEHNKRLQAEIIEREKLIEDLDTFAHTVAHDLKNPLGVTISYAQFINKYNDQISREELEKYTDIIVRNGHKMTAIINELLLLASARQEEVELRPLDMGRIVEEVQQRLIYMLEEAQAEVVVPDKWPTGWGYGPWVEEVWANYISNAIKYGGTPPRIELGAITQPDGLIQFRVWDNGKGLSAAERDKLFKPFTRLDQVRVEGHGLGLSIVQRIVEKLGGTVGATSDNIPGQGSVFYFTLPPYIE